MAEFRLSKEEYVRACRALAARVRLKMLLLVWVVFLAMAVFRTATAEEPLQVALTYLLGAVLATGMFVALARWRDRRVGKGYEMQASLQETITAEIDGDGVRMSQSTGSCELPWDRVVRWDETEEFFLLYESHLFARILAKRAMSEEEVSVVREKVEGIKKG